MPDSAAVCQRRKLGKDAQAICAMIDREVARSQDANLPPAMTDETPIYRQGLRDGMRRIATMIERGDS